MYKKAGGVERRRFKGNPDFRHRSQIPGPEIEEVETKLYELLDPSLMAPRQMERRDPNDPDRPIRMRSRVLTLPVMMAIIVGLVFRRIPSLAEVQRVLGRDGLLWVDPIKISIQAINRRLDTMPAAIVGEVFQEVCDRLKALPSREIPDRWNHLKGVFPSVLVVDGSTLEGLRKKTKELRNEQGAVQGGKIAVMVEAFGLRPVWQSYIEEWTANDKRFSQDILSAVPDGGLVVYDLGFFSFPWFDKFTDQGKYFVTRLREKTAYKVVRLLSEGPLYRDQIVEVGLYRSNPCRHQLRLVEVLWGKRWYRYLTNVLDPEMLSARDVCDLYRTRWRIEDAFGLTKRLLDLAYLWSGSQNAVQLQVYATLIFYGVLIEVCQQVADVLRQPLERISVEMVFRGFYHYSRAFQKGETQDLVSFMVQHSDLLGIVKRKRKSHKEAERRAALIWGDA
jgi:hypothetical protein